MAESVLARKLRMKPAARAAVIGAPERYLAKLEPLPQGVSLSSELEGTFDSQGKLGDPVSSGRNPGS